MFLVNKIDCLIVFDSVLILDCLSMGVVYYLIDLCEDSMNFCRILGFIFYYLFFRILVLIVNILMKSDNVEKFIEIVERKVDFI